MDEVPYFNLENGVLEQLSVKDVVEMYNSIRHNQAQVALGLQLGAQYHLYSLIVPTPVATKATPKRKPTIKKDKTDGKKVVTNTRNTRND